MYTEGGLAITSQNWSGCLPFAFPWPERSLIRKNPRKANKNAALNNNASSEFFVIAGKVWIICLSFVKLIGLFAVDGGPD